MKKILNVLIIATTLFCLVGCGNDNKEKTKETVKENQGENISTEEKSDEETDEEIVIEGNGTDISYIGNMENKSNDVSFVFYTRDDLYFVGTYAFEEEVNIFAFNTNVMGKDDDEFKINLPGDKYESIYIESDKTFREGYTDLTEYFEYNKISTDDMWQFNNYSIIPAYDEDGTIMFYEVYLTIPHSESTYVVKMNFHVDDKPLDKAYVENVLSKLSIEITDTLDSSKYYYEDIIAKYLKDTYGIYVREPYKLKSIEDYMDYYDECYYEIELEDSMEDDAVYVGTYNGETKIFYSKEDETYYFEEWSEMFDEPLYIAIQKDDEYGTFEVDEFKEKFLYQNNDGTILIIAEAVTIKVAISANFFNVKKIG